MGISMLEMVGLLHRDVKSLPQVRLAGRRSVPGLHPKPVLFPTYHPFFPKRRVNRALSQLVHVLALPVSIREEQDWSASHADKGGS